MCAVLNLLGEDVAEIDLARDVYYGVGAVGVNLADFGFAELNVLRALVGKGRGPQNRSGAVVLNGEFFIGFRHTTNEEAM